MTAPPDLLSQAIMRVRPHLDRSTSAAHRLGVLWAGVIAARKPGAADVAAEEFMALAAISGLVADLGRHARADVAHVIAWGLLNRDPFGRAR